MNEAQRTQIAIKDLIDPKVEIAIPKDTVNDLPLRHYNGEIVLINDDDTLELQLPKIRKETVLGFDTESRPVFRRGQSFPPALLQLAGKSCVWLVQIQQLGQLAPIFEILANPGIVKAGVALRDDIKKLNELLEFDAAGFVELSEHTQRVGVVNTGLRNLAAIFLGYRISKGAQVSNWARAELSSGQIRYAATDAWVSRELYLKLEELKLVKKRKNGEQASQQPESA